jgi:hypothetical protein
MIFDFLEFSFDIPNEMIDDYRTDFEAFRDPAMREDLNVIRSSLYDMMLLVEIEPKILNKSDHVVKFAEALAMKQALNDLNLLHDA